MREGWTETTLGEVADVIDPHPSHRAPSVDELGIPFIGIGDLRNTGDVDFSKARKVSREILNEHKLRYSRSDYLIGLGRVASIGMVVKLPDESIDYVISPTLAVIKAQKISPPFLFISLQGNFLQEQFQKYKKGSTRESVGMLVLRKLRIQVPPLAEQKRIVDLISTIDSYIDALSQQIESTKKSRNAVLHELLNKGGVDWVETTLDEVAREGLFSDGDWVETKDQDPNGSFRLLQLADIGDGKFLNKSDRWLNEEQFKRLSCTKLQANDLLIARMPDPISRACLVPDNISTSATVVDVAIIRTNDELLQRILVLIINEKSFRANAQSLLTGTTRQRISRSNLARIKFLLPPLAEQKRIVDLISQFDDALNEYENNLEKTKKLRSALLSDLLSGNHEIPKTYDSLIGAA